MAEKKKVPKHIETLLKNLEKEKRLVDTVDHHYMRGYSEAVQKHLMKDGEIDLKLLDESKNIEKFSDSIADYLLEQGAQALGYKVDDVKKKDVFWKDRMLQAYANTSRSQIRGHVNKYKSDLTHERFAGVKDSFMEDLKKNLAAASGEHLKDEHIDDIVGHYDGLKSKIDRKGVRDVNEAISAFRFAYLNNGGIPDKGLDKYLPEHMIKAEHKRGYKPKKAA